VLNPFELARLHRRRTGRASSWDTSGRNNDRWHIAPGETRVLADIRGPGVITHLWMTQGAGYRECLLKITWDDAPAPSVLCPLGDFFGLGHNIVNSYQSLLFSASTNQNNRFNTGCALNSYVAMPFRKRAVVELINQRTSPQGQYFYIDYEQCSESDLAEMGYFHAEFRRANPFGGWAHDLRVNTAPVDVPNLERQAFEHNYVILDTRGRGQYIGCNLSVTNFQGTWWGEGDDMIWVDGYKWPPDLHGTGSEDYFNQAWGMQRNAFLRNGSSIHEADTQGYQTSYVHHIENPVRFEREIKVTIEVGHGNHLANEVSSVAYWYADQPSAAIQPPPVEQRLPVLRDNQGQWLYDKKSQCPGRPVPLTPEMKKARHMMGSHAQADPERCSSFVESWRLSAVQPNPASLEHVAPPDHRTFTRWLAIHADATHWVSVAPHTGGADGMVYLANRFNFQKGGPWELQIGHDGGMAVFVDGQRVGLEPTLLNPAPVGRTCVNVSLEPGEHDIVIALLTHHGRGQGIFFRFGQLGSDTLGLPVIS
jgi:hypothetical protein